MGRGGPYRRGKSGPYRAVRGEGNWPCTVVGGLEVGHI
jgi:hypothetical protein